MNDKKGIIYVMSTVVDGLIKIGQTETKQFKERMRYLESNGYRNVTGLKREFAIEVDEYDKKEIMLKTIFDKNRIGNTELFALDRNIAIQLLSSFDGEVIFPRNEEKEEIFDNATENRESRLIPDGEYYFKKQKSSDGGKTVQATAVIKNGFWTLSKGSILGINEDKGVSQKAKAARESMKFDEKGILLEDTKLGECTPSFAGVVIMNQSINGWSDWYDKDGKKLDTYRQLEKNEED